MYQNSGSGVVRVGDDDFYWHQRHSWVLEGGRELKGVSVSVVREPGSTRELIIDFSFSVFGVDRTPPRAAIEQQLRDAIPAAAAAGWRSESRGRPFRFVWPDESR